MMELMRGNEGDVDRGKDLPLIAETLIITDQDMPSAFLNKDESMTVTDSMPAASSLRDAKMKMVEA